MTKEKQLEIFIDLWKSENPIKTAKLQALYLFQTILLSAYFVIQGNLGILALGGVIMSLSSLYSIGATIIVNDGVKRDHDSGVKGYHFGNGNAVMVQV